ncbi:MAG: hypothetical protein QFF03_02585 [Pseudomonadota bacterium]|nr:hypothetical protein [Pseudomonadota bacterium]
MGAIVSIDQIGALAPTVPPDYRAVFAQGQAAAAVWDAGGCDALADAGPMSLKCARRRCASTALCWRPAARAPRAG